MILFGGIHELTQELNDMHIYDFINGQWFSILNEAETHSPHAITTGEHKSFTKSAIVSSATKLVGSNRGSVIKEDKEANEFGISVQKTVKKRSRKSNLLENTRQLSISKLEKYVNKKRKAQEQINEETLLTSPTSLSMKNSFLIKTVGKAFDNYYHLHK